MQIHIANATIHISAANGMTLESSTPASPPQAPRLTPPAHGEYWEGQGGYYVCTLPALMGLPERHLIASEHEAVDLKFGLCIDVTGAASQIDGRANTAALLASGDKHPAAEWAMSRSIDGHNDFFLPSRLDLLMAYICAPQIFQKSSWYWSSTQVSCNWAIIQGVENGPSYINIKDTKHMVHAFRWAIEGESA